jgi:hypothetical protein
LGARTFASAAFHGFGDPERRGAAVRREMPQNAEALQHCGVKREVLIGNTAGEVGDQPPDGPKRCGVGIDGEPPRAVAMNRPEPDAGLAALDAVGVDAVLGRQPGPGAFAVDEPRQASLGIANGAKGFNKPRGPGPR